MTESTTPEKRKRGRPARKLPATVADSALADPSFDVEKERRRLLGFVVKTGDVVEGILDGLLSGKEGTSAALVGTVVTSLKQLASLHEEIAKQEAERERRARVATETKEVMPFPTKPAGPAPKPKAAPDYSDRPVLPFSRSAPEPVDPAADEPLGPMPQLPASITSALQAASIEGGK